ncbi:LysE family translocator [Maricaulis sp.]|uniref:LysE family translocator n=1 Tax=Maricaulis sp. TaxID=1486257 RepID=UPI003A90445F
MASLGGLILAMWGTPGPNNLILLTSSALYGSRAAVPHWIGANLGFAILLMAMVFGLGELFERFPWTAWLVRLGGAVWLGWMGWTYIRAGLRGGVIDPAEAAKTSARPMNVPEAMLFQWVNPKGLLLAMSIVGGYSALGETSGERALLMVGVFALFGTPCGLIYVLAGGMLRRVMGHHHHARILNFAIGAVFIATVGMILAAR